MQKLIIIGFGLVVSSLSVFGQLSTKNNYTGSWITNGSWTGGTAPAYTNIGSTNQNFNIQGYITLGSPSPAAPTNMTFANNKDSYSFTVTDTLVVFGNVDFGNQSMDLVLAPGALLIVIGDMSLNNRIDISSSGNIIVTGTFSKQGAANQGSYTGGGNTYAGSFGIPGNWVPAVDRKNTGIDLQTDLLAVYNFINGIGPLVQVLPIELLHFKASKGFANISFSWATASELNFDYFEIEKSSDGKNFLSIAKVSGHGTTNERNDYDAVDEKPYIGKNYYRLKSVDYDGYTEYFNVVLVNFDGSQAFSISPNPSDGIIFNVAINFIPQGRSFIEIYSTQGSEIARFEVYGDKTELVLPEKLASGIYFAKYISLDFTGTFRVMVK